MKVARPVREEEVDGFQNEGVGSLLHSLGSGFDSLAAHQSIVEGSPNGIRKPRHDLIDIYLTYPLDTSMAGAGITPSTANPEPCMIVSDHTAPQCMVT